MNNDQYQKELALSHADLTATRCFEAGVPFPDEWKAYVKVLRSMKDGDPLPAQPPYPAGTQ